MRFLVNARRLGLSLGAIEAQHEVTPEGLAQWMLANEHF